jgi:hypothetical protein
MQERMQLDLQHELGQSGDWTLLQAASQSIDPAPDSFIPDVRHLARQTLELWLQSSTTQGDTPAWYNADSNFGSTVQDAVAGKQRISSLPRELVRVAFTIEADALPDCVFVAWHPHWDGRAHVVLHANGTFRRGLPPAGAPRAEQANAQGQGFHVDGSQLKLYWSTCAPEMVVTENGGLSFYTPGGGLKLWREDGAGPPPAWFLSRFSPRPDDGLVDAPGMISRLLALREVSLRKCNLVPADGCVLAALLRLSPTITSLDLSDNVIGPFGAIAVASAVHEHPTLRNLELFSNCIEDAGGRAVAEALAKNRVLTSLNLRLCRISDASAVPLAVALQSNSTLTSLSLRGNHIGGDGAVAFGETLRVTRTLKELILDKNELGGARSMHISEGIAANPRSALEVLSLYWTQLDDEALRCLGEALGSETAIVRELNLQSLQAPKPFDAGGFALAAAIRKNPRIRKVTLKGTRFLESAKRALADAFAVRMDDGFELIE